MQRFDLVSQEVIHNRKAIYRSMFFFCFFQIMDSTNWRWNPRLRMGSSLQPRETITATQDGFLGSWRPSTNIVIMVGYFQFVPILKSKSLELHMNIQHYKGWNFGRKFQRKNLSRVRTGLKSTWKWRAVLKSPWKGFKSLKSPWKALGSLKSTWFQHIQSAEVKNPPILLI